MVQGRSWERWLIQEAAPAPKYKKQAFCASDSCCRNEIKPEKRRTAQGTKGMVLKAKAKRGDIDCPDCMHALFWSTTKIIGETRASS